KGKAIITIRRVPRWNDKEKPFDGPNKDAQGALEGKQNRGEQHRAVAVIVVNDASEAANDVLMPPFKSAFGISTVSTPFVQVKRAAIEEALKSGTGTGLAETEKAIDANLKPLSAALKGWSVELEVKIKRDEVRVRNVIGYLDGAGPLANEIIVVGAHYD